MNVHNKNIQTNNFDSKVGISLSEKELQALVVAHSKFPEISEARIFGSRVLQTSKRFSDVDIVIFGDAITPTTASGLKGYISDETNFPYFTDIVVYDNNLDSNLKKIIDETSIVFYKK